MANADQVLRVQSTLTNRDHRLLGWLYDHGVLTTPQITHALFSSDDMCHRRLLRLTQVGVVARFRPQRAEGGSFPYHYVIDQLGAEVVAAQRREDPPRRDHARIRRHHLTSKANLAHLTGINQFFIDLAGYQRTQPGATLDLWWPAARFHQSGAFFQAGDDPQVMIEAPRVRPDGHGIWTEHGRTVAFYLEHDEGTETHGVLITKIANYVRLAYFTHRWWPVLFWLPTSARELNLHQQINAEFTRVDVPVATAARDHTARLGQCPAEPVWWLYGRQGGRLPLSALPNGNDDD